jgi:DinB superfamily
MPRPERTEAAEYYFTYIDLVPDGDICGLLRAQGHETLAMCHAIGEPQSRHRYAPDKWSIREVMGHLNDCERMFAFRAMWFARGFESPLPSFDQHVAVAGAASDALPWGHHVDEFRSVRASTAALFEHLPAEAWDRRGIASDNPFTVRALAYIVVGHVTHHLRILRERYLQA